AYLTASLDFITLPLRDALPISEALLAAGIARVVYLVADPVHGGGADVLRRAGVEVHGPDSRLVPGPLTTEAAEVNEAWFAAQRTDRKSTRLNSSHVSISYAVFC